MVNWKWEPAPPWEVKKLVRYHKVSVFCFHPKVNDSTWFLSSGYGRCVTNARYNRAWPASFAVAGGGSSQIQKNVIVL
jgi:hypothetical protein